MHLEADPAGVLAVKGRMSFLAAEVTDLSALTVAARMLFRMTTPACDLAGAGHILDSGVDNL
jgi:hypothetical protein